MLRITLRCADHRRWALKFLQLGEECLERMSLLHGDDDECYYDRVLKALSAAKFMVPRTSAVATATSTWTSKSTTTSAAAAVCTTTTAVLTESGVMSFRDIAKMEPLAPARRKSVSPPVSPRKSPRAGNAGGAKKASVPPANATSTTNTVSAATVASSSSKQREAAEYSAGYIADMVESSGPGTGAFAQLDLLSDMQLDGGLSELLLPLINVRREELRNLSRKHFSVVNAQLKVNYSGNVRQDRMLTLGELESASSFFFFQRFLFLFVTVPITRRKWKQRRSLCG